MVGGGEGIFNTTLTGPGLAIVQSMNHQMFLEALAANKIYTGGRERERDKSMVNSVYRFTDSLLSFMVV